MKIASTIRFVPVVVFVAMGALTLAVWREQANHSRLVLERHTSDVGVQASRRLEIFVESHLTLASVFASRWASREDRDFSRERFEDFASVVLEQVPGFGAFALVAPGSGEVWIVPEGVPSPVVDGAGEWSRAIERAERERSIVLSRPVETGSGRIVFLAVLPLDRDGEFLGHLVAEFEARTLIDDCFHERIRSEFSFVLTDGSMSISTFAPDGETWLEQSPIRASREFPVRNRTWRLTVVPRSDAVREEGWRSSLSVLLLGFLLSASLGLLVHLLLRRMDLYRSARDRALSEIEERRKAESALDATRSRYKSVFESATDGMIIFDQEGRIVEANAAACTMHGYEPGALEGKMVRSLIAPDHQRQYDTFMRILDEEGRVRIDSLDVRSDGSTFDVEVRGTDFQFAGEPRVLAVLTDVSARKQAEEKLTLLSRKILIAQEEERARLSRDLHDELGQLLTAQRLELDWLQKRMKPVAHEDPLGFENAVKLVEDATGELRRICRGLRPPLLDDLGVEPAVSLLVQEFEERTGIVTDLDVRLEDDLEDLTRELALCIYRILQESLTNVSRHSGARNVSITLVYSAGTLLLSVYDDGKGFEIEHASVSRGSGITGMQERAHLVGGSVDVRSAPDKGTRVVFRVPGEE